MSAKQISLKSPATIAVVVVLLVAVVGLNIQTFGGRPGGHNTSRGYRVQAHPPVPSDVTSLVNRDVAKALIQGRQSATTGVQHLGRDPFFERKNQPQAQPKTRVKRKSGSSAVASRAKPLQCSAIMLGGKNPMAIIDGEGRYPGDKIRGMTLVGIDADGVTFKKSNGSTTHLAVGVQDDKNSSFRVVTRARKSGDQGQTHLVGQ